MKRFSIVFLVIVTITVTTFAQEGHEIQIENSRPFATKIAKKLKKKDLQASTEIGSFNVDVSYSDGFAMVASKKFPMYIISNGKYVMELLPHYEGGYFIGGIGKVDGNHYDFTKELAEKAKNKFKKQIKKL